MNSHGQFSQNMADKELIEAWQLNKEEIGSLLNDKTNSPAKISRGN
jgi:hypothetical protein